MTCTRREFVAGAVFLLSGCGTSASYRPERNDHGEYVVPKSLFVDAQAVQLDHKRLKVPIVVANIDGEFHASEMICPHQGCLVKINDDKLVCPCHGSTFMLDGTLTIGPAEENLREIVVEEHEEFVLVSIS